MKYFIAYAYIGRYSDGTIYKDFGNTVISYSRPDNAVEDLQTMTRMANDHCLGRNGFASVSVTVLNWKVL